MNRRTFILGSLATGVLVGGGVAWFGIEQNQEPLDIDFALTKLDKLMQQSPKTMGEWNLFQVLTHCAQSVEYSLVGYPQQKPDIFKSTLGTAAFAAFSSKGRMTHALDEVIPGAPAFSSEENTLAAYKRFKQSLIDFQEYDGVLAPHFAYGQLTKQQYEMAHVMHFNNHLQEIEIS